MKNINRNKLFDHLSTRLTTGASRIFRKIIQKTAGKGNMYLIQRVHIRNTPYYINLFVKTTLNRLAGLDKQDLELERDKFKLTHTHMYPSSPYHLAELVA